MKDRIEKLLTDLKTVSLSLEEKEELVQLVVESKALTGPGYTPNPKLQPLGDGPRRKMLIAIEVSADFEKRLDNQWMVEREIHADRWSWEWADETHMKQAHEQAIWEAQSKLQ